MNSNTQNRWGGLVAALPSIAGSSILRSFVMLAVPFMGIATVASGKATAVANAFINLTFEDDATRNGFTFDEFPGVPSPEPSMKEWGDGFAHADRDSLTVDGHSYTMFATAIATASYPPDSGASGFAWNNGITIRVTNTNPFGTLLAYGVTYKWNVAAETDSFGEYAWASAASLFRVDPPFGAGGPMASPSFLLPGNEVMASNGDSSSVEDFRSFGGLAYFEPGQFGDFTCGFSFASVEATAVPEPSTYGAAGIAMLFFLMLKRCRYKDR